MADIKVLMVTDGNRFTYGTPPNTYDTNFFGLTTLVNALRGSTTPTIQVDTAHRRGAAFAGPGNDPDTSVNLTIPGDFVFTSIDLSQYDVIWMIGDEGYNGGALDPFDQDILPAEKFAIAQFMQNGGGVFAVGDHDGIGAFLCGSLPRVRTMRKWFEWDHPFTDPGTSQKFMPNWSAVGSAASPGYPGETDRFDTLRPDSALFGGAQAYFFWDQSDANPQPLMTQSGTPLATSPGPIHAVLRGVSGVTIANFPDHMHEGEATDFTTISTTATPFNPNDASNNPNTLPFTDQHGTTHNIVEFPKSGGFQPQPEVVAYASDLGHGTYYGSVPPGQSPDFAATAAKTRGAISVYDGYSAGVGRIITGSTFHHYLDKNLIGDPGSTAQPGPPTGTDTGLHAADLDPITNYYIDAVTWLARAKPNFHFWTIKNTFGKDEVQDAATHGQSFSNAFYLALEGFAPNTVGNPTIHLSGPFAATGAVMSQGSAIYSGNANTPQRILFPFTIVSIPLGAFPPHGNPATLLPLEAGIAFGSNAFNAEALFELAAGADPYFTNVDPTTNPPNAFYLSQDLRVFQVVPGLNPVPFIPFPGGSDAPFTYMQNLLTYLNDPSHGYTMQGGSDPFQTLSEQNDLTEDSSVTPTVLGPGGAPFTAYNFAIARVRLKGTGSPASDVKVFFRMFATQSNDTDYDPQTTYVSTYDASHLPDKPLTGADNTTFPFYATSNGSGDYDPGFNDKTITGSSGSETWTYFGCYLNVYDLPANSLPGTHHCLVAQIAYDGAPILNSNGLTLSPENTDKLAQRNLQVTPSGNPGGPATHRIPQTFDNKPSLRTTHAATTLLGYPDELMIDWGNTPKGSIASIYWPQANAIDVVRLSMLLYATDQWTAADEHTVQCTINHPVTYLPIPFGTGPNFAGLFTVDLPAGVRKGREFHIVVRRVRSRRSQPVRVPPSANVEARAATVARTKLVTDWRYVAGTFQVTIPVSTEEELLWPEENTLAIMKWRFLHTLPSSRWYPVLRRYLSYITGRVNGFGGNAGSIMPSPTGAPPPNGGKGDGHVVRYTGKVCDVFFDCFGDFEGFVLATCSGSHKFVTREKGIADVAIRACRDRLVLTVFTEGHEHKIRQLVVTCC